ncbi:FadR/GntR family transcriptional regulator [Desulfosporosinus sp. BICA1-9]|uniref:FadR/GntR family transcriptional regulator n=1 Tax=Desulfosporosinus sp. BICA1-9 TaxID=1531958 RepID=UPI000B090EB7|nr:FadR/GntR family transcriptional regulator [Desulfosporosinus sp. BICA1-9]
MGISDHSEPMVGPESSLLMSINENGLGLVVEPIKTQKIYQVVFESIRDSIINGELKAGQKLPPERVLAKRFQVSRTSIREALMALEISGIIEIKSSEGSFIRQIETKTLINDLSAAIIKAEDSMVYEMLEVRRLIESECAALAAVRASSFNLARIRQHLDDMAKSEFDEESGLSADVNFHYSVAQAANSPILFDLMKVLVNRMKGTIRATRCYRFSQPNRFEETLNEHKDIYIAISSNNPDRARSLMTKHLIDIREEIAIISLVRNKLTFITDEKQSQADL